MVKVQYLVMNLPDGSACPDGWMAGRKTRSGQKCYKIVHDDLAELFGSMKISLPENVKPRMAEVADPTNMGQVMNAVMQVEQTEDPEIAALTGSMGSLMRGSSKTRKARKAPKTRRHRKSRK